MSSGFLENYRKVSTWTPRRRRGGTSCVWPWPCPSRARRSPPAARSGPSQAGAGGGGGAARPPAGPPTGTCPGSRQKASARTRSTGSTRPTRTTRSRAPTFQNDAYKTSISTARRRRPGAHHHLGLGRRRPAQLRAGGPGRGPVVVVRPERGPSRAGCSPRRSRAATVDGKIYAMPAETVQPIVLYYNKKVFDKVGAQPPQSWGDIMNLVPKFNAAGVAPFSLGGQSRWTNMMWLEFLLDRIGGSEVFQTVFDGQKDAWSNPAAHGRAHEGAGPGQGQRLHQGLLVDHRRLQRRPGPALHRTRPR